MTLQDLVDAAEEQGWRVGTTRRGHVRFTPPDPTQEQVIASGTSGDANAVRLVLSRLRRSGFVWPWPPPKGRT